MYYEIKKFFYKCLLCASIAIPSFLGVNQLAADLSDTTPSDQSLIASKGKSHKGGGGKQRGGGGGGKHKGSRGGGKHKGGGKYGGGSKYKGGGKYGWGKHGGSHDHHHHHWDGGWGGWNDGWGGYGYRGGPIIDYWGPYDYPPPIYIEDAYPPIYIDSEPPTIYVEPNFPPSYAEPNYPPSYAEPNYPPSYAEPNYYPPTIDIDVDSYLPSASSGGGGSGFSESYEGQGMEPASQPSTTTPTIIIIQGAGSQSDSPPPIIINPPSVSSSSSTTRTNLIEIPGRPYELTKTESRTIVHDCQSIADPSKYDPELWRQAYDLAYRRRLTIIY